jgi:hypothetical protein
MRACPHDRPQPRPRRHRSRSMARRSRSNISRVCCSIPCVELSRIGSERIPAPRPGRRSGLAPKRSLQYCSDRCRGCRDLPAVDTYTGRGPVLLPATAQHSVRQRCTGEDAPGAGLRPPARRSGQCPGHTGSLGLRRVSKTVSCNPVLGLASRQPRTSDGRAPAGELPPPAQVARWMTPQTQR